LKSKLRCPLGKKEINESEKTRKEYKNYMKQVVLGPQGFTININPFNSYF